MSKLTLKVVLAGVCIVTAAITHAELRDPTKPATFVYTETKSQAANVLKLTAIWITESSRRATINGVTAKQGQTILNDLKIIQIRSQSVIVRQYGKNRTLQLLKHKVKKPRAILLP